MGVATANKTECPPIHAVEPWGVPQRLFDLPLPLLAQRYPGRYACFYQDKVAATLAPTTPPPTTPFPPSPAPFFSPAAPPAAPATVTVTVLVPAPMTPEIA